MFAIADERTVQVIRTHWLSYLMAYVGFWVYATIWIHEGRSVSLYFNALSSVQVRSYLNSLIGTCIIHVILPLEFFVVQKVEKRIVVIDSYGQYWCEQKEKHNHLLHAFILF